MTDLNTDQLDAIERELRAAKGRSQAVSSGEIAEKYVPSDSSGNPKTREAIKHLMRDRGLPVVGGGQGYFIPHTNAEISENVQSLQERIEGIKERQRLLVDNWAAHTGTATDGGSEQPSEWEAMTDEERRQIRNDSVLEAEDFK